MKKIDSRKDKILIVLAVYTIGTLLGVLVLFLRIIRVIRVLNWDRFPKYHRNLELFKHGLIVVSNHPSLLEPLLVSALFFGQYITHPFKLSPWNIAEVRNYKKWYWQWASTRIIWVDRKNSEKAKQTFIKVKNTVNSGGLVVIFPEGGRTFKREKLYSRTGNKQIAILQEGIGLLIRKTDAPVLFIWVEGSDEFFPNTIWIEGKRNKFPFPRFWKKITIKIGQIVRFEKVSKEEITQQVAAHLLKLADEEE
ncbi:1-acyl-sn-glycerol-3-phosphate acyltransferase [Patescibacteria group bacterium]|nr:1-acyl-sn-glycerol-3-phosphate acyltransferase [Patescibacteria group bacterium]